MIHFVVSANYLRDALEIRHGASSEDLYNAILPIYGKPILSVDSINDLSDNSSVFDLLQKFHVQAISLIKQHARHLIIEHRNRLENTARRDYHQPLFKATEEDAAASLAIHALFPHGVIDPSQAAGARQAEIPVVLPDFLMASRLYADFPLTYWSGCHNQVSPDQLFEAWKNPDYAAPVSVQDFSLAGDSDRENLVNTYNCIDQTIINLGTKQRTYLECHLCDRLKALYKRAFDFWNDVAQQEDDRRSKTAKSIIAASKERHFFVVIGSISSFRGYQATRSLNLEIPSIGHHPLLTSAILRQGMAFPVISSCFSKGVWDVCDAPVKHFLLQAAELIGRSQYQPLYSHVPMAFQMRSLFDAVRCACTTQDIDISEHESVLRQLGIMEVLRKMRTNELDADHDGWGNRWGGYVMVKELHDTMLENNVERSLQLQDIFDLYPLHKRVLGLMEYVLKPRIEKLGFSGSSNMSALWTNAFLGEKGGEYEGPLPCDHEEKDQRSAFATLEVVGNWLHHANVDGKINYLGLDNLLDKIVESISGANEVSGVSVNLKPSTPQDHARQLAALSEEGKQNGAFMTLYLGKIALELRNAVEHGTDEVQGDGLLVKVPGYWKVTRKKHWERGGLNLPILEWTREAAKRSSWRRIASLPKEKDVPSAANAILLTPASLHRCLVLMSLVLRAGFSHLKIE